LPDAHGTDGELPDLERYGSASDSLDDRLRTMTVPLYSDVQHEREGPMRYRINAPHVIAETMAGETIIVHLSTGCYFNLAGASAEIWDSLTADETAEETVARLQATYDAAPGAIEAGVRRLLDELVAEELLVVADGADERARTTPPAPAAGERKPFPEPSLNKFTDMQDIILLDPVHEVDARGWPYEQTEA
jgi:hypothetical protein